MADHLNITMITLICNGGQEVQMKRSLLPRLRGVHRLIHLVGHLGDPAMIRVDGLKRETVLKLIAWLEHYKTTPEPPKEGEVIQSTDWDLAFFEDITGNQYIELVGAAKKFEVDGLESYCSNHLTKRFTILPLNEKTRFYSKYFRGEEKVLLQIAQHVFDKK